MQSNNAEKIARMAHGCHNLVTIVHSKSDARRFARLYGRALRIWRVEEFPNFCPAGVVLLTHEHGYEAIVIVDLNEQAVKPANWHHWRPYTLAARRAAAA